MIKKLAVLFLGVLVLAAGCTKKDAAPAATTAATPGGAPAAAAPAKPVPAQLPDVVARVNGQDVKKSELEMAVKTLEDRAGSSVPPEQRGRIFGPFYRRPGAGEREGGVGLGLALVKSIAERHGGSVRCEAREGGGACFTVRLPRSVS